MIGARFSALLAALTWVAALTPEPSAQAAVTVVLAPAMSTAISNLCLRIFDEKDKLIPLDPQPESLTGLRILVRYTTPGRAHHAISGTILDDSGESITLLTAWGEPFEIPKSAIHTLALLADRKLPRAQD